MANEYFRESDLRQLAGIRDISVDPSAEIRDAQAAIASGSLSPLELREVQNYINSMGQKVNMTPQQIEQAAASGKLPEGTKNLSGTSRSTSTSRNIYDDDAMAQFQGFSNRLLAPGGLYDQAGAAVVDQSRGYQTTGLDLVASINAAGEAAGAKAKAEAELLAAAAARRSSILTRANLNPDIANSRMEQALDELDRTSAMLDVQGAEIRQRQSVGFFDNPLEWLVNQTRLPGMIAEHNGLVQVQQNALGKYEAAKDIASSSISISQAMDADKILVAGNAAAQAAATEAKAKADTVRLQLQTKAAQDALQLAVIGGQAADLSYKALLLTKQQQAEREGASQREAARLADEKVQSDFNLMVRAAGGFGLAPDRYKNLSTAERDVLARSVSTRKFGSDLTSAIKFVDHFGNFDKIATDGGMAQRTWVQGTMGAANAIQRENQIKAQNPATANKNYNPQKDLENIVNGLGAQYESQSEVNMIGAPQNNPYKINYEQALKDPKYAGNIWVENLGKDNVEFKEDRGLKYIATQALAMPQSQDFIKKAAADVANFYQSATKTQRLATKPELYGLNTPSKIYAAQIPELSVKDKKGNIATVDLGDPAQVENLLVRYVAANTYRQINFKERAATSPFFLTN